MEMTEQEYRDELKALEASIEASKKELAKRYAFANQKFQIGDTISKNETIIIVDDVKWGFTYGTSLPSVVYRGIKLTKKLVPPKRGDLRDTIWQFDGHGIVKLKHLPCQP